VITPNRHHRSALGAMYAGLALTVVATVVPFVAGSGSGGLAGHIRAGYPGYSPDRIHAAVDTYLICLSVIGLLGVVCWLGTIWAVNARKPWARGVAAATCAAAWAVALTDLLIKDTSGDTGLPPLVGWTGVLPCFAGLLAVALLWRRPTWTVASDQPA
jgi:hypothetical protein